MMLAHAEYIEADLIGEFNLFYEIAEPLLRRKGGDWFRDQARYRRNYKYRVPWRSIDLLAVAL